MNRFGPVGRWQFLKVLSTLFQVLNQIKQHIYRPVLSGRPMLIHDRVNGHGRVNARQLMPGLIASKGLHDGDDAVLTIFGIPSPPNDSEDLTWTEVVHTASLALFVLIRRRAKAQALKTGPGNVASDETGQADGAQTAPLSLLQFDFQNITLTDRPASRPKCVF